MPVEYNIIMTTIRFVIEFISLLRLSSGVAGIALSVAVVVALVVTTPFLSPSPPPPRDINIIIFADRQSISGSTRGEPEMNIWLAGLVELAGLLSCTTQRAT